jgi:putative transposase
MNRVPPSERIGESIALLLSRGLEGDGSVVAELMRLGAQRFVQELVEREVTAFLGRGHYERRPAGEELLGYRNGYRPKSMNTAEGPVPVQIPQVRGSAEPFHSQVVAFLERNSDVLERLVAEMYARGLSTRDIEDALRDATGERLLTRTDVSQGTESLWAEYLRFRDRKLNDFDVVYLFLDAIFEPLRRTGTVKDGVLVAWGILRDGRRVLLHMAMGSRESEENWLEFLRDRVRRGLGVPLSITTDGAPGLIAAVEAMWPKSIRIRCWAHKVRNILDKVPDEMRAEIKAYLAAVREAPNPDEGKKAAEAFIARYERQFPSAVRSFTDDLPASLAHLKLPAAHRKFVRTTNLIERSFEEERRRTKTIPRFFDEHSALKLVFGALTRATARWQRLRITDLEQRHIARLRHQLGLEPPPQPPTHQPEPENQSPAASEVA